MKKKDICVICGHEAVAVSECGVTVRVQCVHCLSSDIQNAPTEDEAWRLWRAHNVTRPKAHWPEVPSTFQEMLKCFVPKPIL